MPVVFAPTPVFQLFEEPFAVDVTALQAEIQVKYEGGDNMAVSIFR